MSSIAVNAITDANAGNTATINAVTPNVNNVVGKNRIINGNMGIWQRATSITGSTGYSTVDRWDINGAGGSTLNVAQSTDTPAGFSYSTAITVGTASAASGAYAYALYAIEGYNLSDLDFGSSTAKSVTLSFWAKSSVTGTYGLSFRNTGTSRYYTTTYTINSANTWEYKTLTITGDTTGTWLKTNGIGMQLIWDLGVGSTYSSASSNAWSTVGSNYFGVPSTTKLASTLGATFYITGVQLEAGSLATAFEYRQYGTELSLCQRYFEKSNSQGTVPGDSVDSSYQTGGSGYATNGLYTSAAYFKVTKRASPNITIYKPTAGTVNGAWIVYSGGWVSSTTSVNNITDSMFSCNLTSNIVQNTGYAIQGAWTASSEF
jgi:hypothetical protein